MFQPRRKNKRKM